MGYVVFFGLLFLAIPVGIVYLLIRVNSQQRSIDQLNRQVDEISRREFSADLVSQQPSQELTEKAIELAQSTLLDEQQEPEPSKEVLEAPDNFVTPIAEANQSNMEQVVTSLSAEEPLRGKQQANIKPDLEMDTDSGPDLGDKIGQFIKSYFTGGNLIVRVGIIVLFFGVAFLLKYAAENSLFPIELRLAAVGISGIALLIVGWRLRIKRRAYALIMQGGGVGILYLTMYASLRLYDLLPASVVIVVMLLMVSLAAMLAILQNAHSLAVLAAVGGFLAPILTSTGDGSHITLFSYYLLLNIGILLMAWFKSWRLLNLIGFAFTFVIGAAWGVLRYQPEHFVSTEIFLVVFFLFYVAIALLYARQQPPRLRGLVDGTLVFGTPLVVFTLQTGLVQDYEYGMAWSALAAGGFYLMLALQCWRIGAQNYRLLTEALLALGVIFASLTIPFALDGNGVAAAWALEGAGILWISVQQKGRLRGQQLGIVFGLLLQLSAGMALLIEHTFKGNAQPVFNSVFMGAVMVALAGLFSSYYLLKRYRQLETKPWEYQASGPLLVWGLCWWFGNGITEIIEYQSLLPWAREWVVVLGFVAVSVAILGLLERKLNWYALRYAVVGLIVTMVFVLLHSVEFGVRLFLVPGLIVWPLAFMVVYTLLKQRDSLSDSADITFPLLPWLHTTTALLLVTVLTIELLWIVGDYGSLGGAWLAVAFALVPVLALATILKAKIWPLTKHTHIYMYKIAGLILIYLSGWSVLVNLVGDGQALPLPYIPFLNPIDIVQAIILLSMLAWWRQIDGQVYSSSDKLSWQLVVFVGLVFVWLNGIVLRSLHHWADVPFSFDGFYDSALTQACLSIFWTMLGLTVMVLASKRHWRKAWVAAAVLLGVVVLKLFSVDLNDSNTLESIFSFIVVGMLLLVIGYYSPIPPNRIQQAE